MIGDVCLSPATTSMQALISSRDWIQSEQEKSLGIQALRQGEDLDRVFWVASNGDGHRYYLSAVSHRFYVWWHFGPECVEACDLGDQPFIDWLVELHPEQPKSRPWAAFTVLLKAEMMVAPGGEKPAADVLQNVSMFSYAHSTCFPLAEIEALAEGVLSNPVIYRNDTTWSVIDPGAPLLIEVFHHHRGFNTRLDFSINNRAASDAAFVARVMAFQKSLAAGGFCHPDRPDLIRDGGDS